jgi:H+-transporting ATPase
MATGDSAAIASEIAGQLGMGTHIQLATDLFTGDVTKGGISPAEKVEKLKASLRSFPSTNTPSSSPSRNSGTSLEWLAME